MRLVIVQPYVPAYRSEFYRRIRAQLSEQDIEVEIVVGSQSSSRQDADGKVPVSVRKDLLSPVTRGHLRYRPLHGVADRGDLLLLEQAVKNLDAFPALARRSLGGPSVGMWGHGRTYSAPQRRGVTATKHWLSRRADWFFVYTEAGARYLSQHGVSGSRISVLRNTFDTDALRDSLGAISEAEVHEFARSLNVRPERTVLFLGGVDPRKDTRFLQAVADEAHRLDPHFALLVAGAGGDVDRLRQAQESGAALRMLGRADGRTKALALRTAKLLVIPSQVGLVVIDSFVSGVPIISRSDRLHGPEVEYLDPSNSVLLPRGVTSSDVARHVVNLLHDAERLQTLSENCLSRAAAFRLDDMVDSFVAGVLGWADVVRFGL